MDACEARLDVLSHQMENMGNAGSEYPMKKGYVKRPGRFEDLERARARWVRTSARGI